MNELPCILKDTDTTWCGERVKSETRTLEQAVTESRSNLIDCCPRCANAVIVRRAPLKEP